MTQRLHWKTETLYMEIVRTGQAIFYETVPMVMAVGSCHTCIESQSRNDHVLFENGSVSQALEHFSKSGCIHKKPTWRHVRRWKNNLTLIDMMGSIKNASAKNIHTWKVKIMLDLRATTGGHHRIKRGHYG
jgi:hypothetical protein